MSWFGILRAVFDLIKAIVQKLRVSEKPTQVSDTRKPITRASVDKQIAHQRELYRRNHPEK